MQMSFAYYVSSVFDTLSTDGETFFVLTLNPT